MSKLKEYQETLVNCVYTYEDGTVEKHPQDLDGSISGSGFYCDIQNGVYGMIDAHNDYEFTELGETIEQALISLSNYIEYFQGEEEDEYTWHIEFIEDEEVA